MAEQNRSYAIAVEVKIKEVIEATDLHMFSVEQDLDQPDMATVVIRNENHSHTEKYALGDPVEVNIGDDKKAIFKGEIVALEGAYKNGGETMLIVRAFNKLHRLTRARKSKTYVDMKDSAIVQQIAGEYSLSAQCGTTSITHKHVYQHNQTDLEFLRVRAARIGFDVWVEDTKLFFDKPKLDSDSGVELSLQDVASAGERATALTSFSPRLSSAQVPTKVEVIGWDPDKKERIVGQASSEKLKNLGSAKATSQVGVFGDAEMIHSDHPVASQEEATAMAEARLDKLALGYITGEGSAIGNAELKPGIVVKVTVNPDKADDLFNGKYYVIGCTHRFRQSGGPGGGYVTVFRYERNASKGE